MKKFTTTFFLLMAMVLLLPTEMKATDYYLIGDFNKWSTTDTSYKFTVNGNTATAQISAAAFSSNGTDNDGVYFAVNAIESSSNRWYLRPSKYEEITEGSQYNISSYYNNYTNNSFCFKNPATSSTEIYTITLDFSSSNDINKSILTVTKSGSGGGETGTGYYLYCSTGGVWSSASTYCVNSDNELKYADGKYNVTFTIPASTSEFYFCVFNGEMKRDWSNAIRPYGKGDVTTTTGTIQNTSEKVWKQTTSSDAVTYKLVLDGFTNGSAWNLTKVTAPTTTYTLKYGSTLVTGTVSGANVTFKLPQAVYGQAFTIAGSDGKTYNPDDANTSLGKTPLAYTTTGTGSWTCAEESNASGYTLTLNTTDKTVVLDYSTTTVTPPTPVTGKNIYFVGDLFDKQTAIDYNCRYFKMTDNGDNTYSIDLPATLTVKAQLLVVDGETETVYGPNGNGYGISYTWPGGNDESVEDQPLAAGEKTPAKYWSFNDRGLASDGMYTLTVKLNDEGVPTKWSIKHDLLTRVAYFIAKTEGATVHPAYSKRNNENASGDNKYFGSIYLPANTGCYVISNITKQSDSGNHDLRKTTTKFYLQGTETGGNPITGNSKDTKVFPVQYNGSATIYKPFVFNATEGMQYLLEYNPTQGEDEIAKNYGYVGGEVQVRKGGTLGDLVVKSMKIVGPAIKGDGWDLTANALDMTYNLSENCWEVTFDTTNPAGEYFRFVANDDWKSHWIENGTTDEDKAKIPYDGAGVGQPATVAVPNEVLYTTTERAESNKEYDIIFNRNAGRWTVKFYIETESDQGGNYFKYKFRYTINGYKSVLRTYCMPENRKPTDENIKIYGAYAFDDKSGKVKLYEMNYIPANEGVILIGTGVAYVEAAIYTPKEGETKYKNIADTNYKNYLVGVLADTKVNASVFEGNKRTGRNFFFNYLSNTGYYEDGATDYLGFFRVQSGSTCMANYAYLYLPTTVLTWNGQTLDDVLEDGTSTLSKGIKMVFGIADEDFGSVTGINDIQKEVKADNSYYTLQGIRVNTPSKGIYIHNGRKVVIK